MNLNNGGSRDGHHDSTTTGDDDLVRALRAEITPADSAPREDSILGLRALVEERAHAVDPPRMQPGRVSRRGGRHTGRIPWSTERRLVTAAAGVALVAVGGIAGVAMERVSSSPAQDALARGTAEFTAHLVGDGITVDVDGARAPEGRILTLESPSLPALSTGEYYEVWFVDDDGARISAGTFHPDTQGDTLVVLHAAVDPGLVGEMEITHESPDGDPGPSGDVVAQGRVDLD